MLKTFKYRIYPNKKQIRIMDQWLEECRWLFNYFLAERKEAWKQEQKSISYYAQATSLPVLKEQRPSLTNVHSQVLQNVAIRIDLAFKAFFCRVRTGKKFGYPRFRGKGRYDSFTFPQSGFNLDGNMLWLSKIGNIKVVLHRPVEGKIKTCTIKRSATGKWYVMFSCEWEPIHLPENDQAVGVDVGLHSFATLSTGEHIENPKFFRREEKVLIKAQRKLSKAEKGTPERKKRRKVVTRIYERIAWKRRDFIHQLTRKIVNHFGIIAVEDIHINSMLHNHYLTKDLSDAAWSRFFQLLSYKAEWAGRELVTVNPAYTSQDCSNCGHRQIMPLSKRIFKCPCCNTVLDRDYNAALNILRLGTQSPGIQSPKAPLGGGSVHSTCN